MKRWLACVWMVCLIGCDPEQAKKEDSLPPDLRTRKTGSDWPCFLGPTGDSVSSEKGILTSWPKEGPKVLWEKKLGNGYSQVVTSRGRVFLFDRVADKARLRTCNSETGEDLWSFEYETSYEDQYRYSNGPRCSPVVDGSQVYVFGPEGMLHCVRAEDGKLVWKVDTRKEFGVIQNFFGVGSTPVIEGELLLAMIGGSPKGSEDKPFDELTGNGSGIVAFDKHTGQVRWEATDELASYSSPVLATIDGRRWDFVYARGGLVGFDPATGKVDFHHPWRAKSLESVNASNPVVVGKRVLITECYGPGSALLEVKPGSCKEVWTDENKGRNRSLQCHWNTPVHVDDFVYGSSGRHTDDAELRCVELATGKVMWREPGLTRCSLLLVDGHFICQGEYGHLFLIKVNPNKYDEVDRVQLRPLKDGKPAEDARPLLEYPAWAAPVLSHGLLYVRGKDRLVCLELIPGKK